MIWIKSTILGLILQWINNPERKCCSQINSHKQNPRGVWWNNAGGKVICTVQAWVIVCYCSALSASAGGGALQPYSFPSHLWPGGWPPPHTQGPLHFVTFSAIHLCQTWFHFGFQRWKLTINISCWWTTRVFSQKIPNFILHQIYFWTPSLIELWN